MAPAVLPLRSTSVISREVTACSVSGRSAQVCSSSMPSASAAFRDSGKDGFDTGGAPCISLRVGSGGSFVRLRAEPVRLFHPLGSNFGNTYAFSVRKRRSITVTVAASVEKGVKDSGSGEKSTASSDSSKVEPPSSSTSPMKTPMKSGGKISSIAAKQSAVDSKPPGSAEDTSAGRKPALSVRTKQPSPVGQLSPKAAEQLKVSKPTSVFTQGTGAAKAASSFTTGAAQKSASPFAQPGGKPASPFVQPSRGKRVVDAFKEGEKEGKTTKFGQPVVPANIFQDVKRTPEEVAADAFKFSISPGQFLLIGSFLLIIALMVGTAFVVWKLGGIHYNEY